MKNIELIKGVRTLLMAVVYGSIVSCTALDPLVEPVDPDVPEESPGEVTYHINSTLEQPVATKMKLSGDDASGYDLIWHDDDRIYVVGYNAAGKSTRPDFTITSGGGTTHAEFDVTMAEGYTPRYAVFPYNTALKVNEHDLTFNLAQRKYAMEGNIAQTLSPCVAMIEETEDGLEMPFKNLMGLFRITLTSETPVNIKKITIHDNAGNILWGTCTVPILEHGELDYEHARFAGGDNSIYMLWTKYATINKTPKSFYFSVPPGAFDRGYSIVIYEYDTKATDNVGKAYTFLQKVSNPKAITRSVILAVDAGSIKDKSEPLDPTARGYYKSLFVDAGSSLNTYYTPEQIPAIASLGLENDYEYLATGSYYNLQTDILGVNDGTVGSTHIKYRDDNGVLLYPDCSPRFRAVFVNGGTSSSHGDKLGVEGRRNFHDFFINGGSYVGACAGAILASTTVDSVNHYDSGDGSDYTFGMWPGNVTHTGWPADFGQEGSTSVYTAMTATDAMIAASEGDLFSGIKIEDVRHHGGIVIRDSHLAAYPEGERLMNYAYSSPNEGGSSIADAYRFSESTVDNPVFGGKNWNGNCSTFAYKHVDAGTGVDTGRAILCGSHFENAASGSQLKAFATMIKYALAGTGVPRIKGEIHIGQKIDIDKAYSDADPAHAKIGDRQYHHFKLVLDEDVDEFTLKLDSKFDADSGIDLYLALRKGDIAWLSDSDYVLCNKGGKKEFNIKKLAAGTYYVSVFCATGITSTAMDYTPSGASTPSSFYFAYSGHTELMEGVAYSLSVTSGSADGGGTDGGTDEGEDDI